MNFNFFFASQRGKQSRLRDWSELKESDRERYELLSAFLDGEASEDRAREVRQWLSSDAEIQRVYWQLVRLREQWREMPVPSVPMPLEERIRRVFVTLERRRRQVFFWSGSAIALVLVAFVGAERLPTATGFSMRILSLETPATSPTSVSLSINQPLVEIPKLPVGKQIARREVLPREALPTE